MKLLYVCIKTKDTQLFEMIRYFKVELISMLLGRPMMILTEFLESGSLDHFLKVSYLHLVFCTLSNVSLAIDNNKELVFDLVWRGFKNFLP